jgi:hypothetical protein
MHLRLKDVFIPVVGWAVFIAYTVRFNYFDLTSPFGWSSLLLKVTLPLIVYIGLIVKKARGRVEGNRTVEA